MPWNKAQETTRTEFNREVSIMNTISRTGIEGFDYCFNPVRGCLTGCTYCWARGLTRRFAESTAKAEVSFLRRQRGLGIPASKNEWDTNIQEFLPDLRNFKPTWLEYQFAKPFPKKPSRIVVGWQSDIAYWQPEWIGRVLAKIKDYPQHQFFFLTKQPLVYLKWYMPHWLGTTITNQAEYDQIVYTQSKRQDDSSSRFFLSIEPLLGWMGILPRLKQITDWLIIGAQTGSGEKVPPKREWVETIINQARLLKIPVYLKDNLLKAVPGLPRLKEMPG
jgi:protein gp37